MPHGPKTKKNIEHIYIKKLNLFGESSRSSLAEIRISIKQQIEDEATNLVLSQARKERERGRKDENLKYRGSLT